MFEDIRSLQKVIYSLESSHQEKCNIKAVFEKGSQFNSNHDIVQFELVDMNKQLFPVNVNDLPLDELINGQEVNISYIDTFDLNEVHRVGIGATITCLSEAFSAF